MELCMHIKDNPSFCHLPVVLLTAKSMTMHVEEGFQAGADDYLVKDVYKRQDMHNAPNGRCWR